MDDDQKEVNEYIGRFAPTPSGGLHLGSLMTAVASFVDAKAEKGDWILRIDDIDKPRVVEGAEYQILKTLEIHGLEWDGPVTHQSDHMEHYRAALASLKELDLLFYCTCSRKSLRKTNSYTGKCRNRKLPITNSAIRLTVDSRIWETSDLIQGNYYEQLNKTVGDFVIWRRDDIPSYQLAVVVDDNLKKVNHIVRGFDLLDNVGRQLYLLDSLGQTAPRYLHVPTINDAKHTKLSKHDDASVVNNRFPERNLQTVLQLLGQSLPPYLQNSNVHELLEWAKVNWQRSALPKNSCIPNYNGI